MQKIIQRRVAAEAQVARRAQRGAANKESDKIWVTRYQAKERRAMVAVNVKNERKHRREDWDCGPRLAPQRSAGTGFESYGVVEQNAVQQPERTKKERKGLWAAEGDRVVILKGRDMGRIGTVKNADWEAESVTVKGMNLGDWAVPEAMRMNDPNSQRIMPTECALPLEDVKLVFPMPDPHTGALRDVIVDRIELSGNFFSQRKQEYQKGIRRIAGALETIPWPETEEPEPVEHDDDTLRITVEEITDRPVLLAAPMPRSVIDELRGKYSIFRTRHEPEYVAKKLAMDRAVERKELLAKSVMTPMMELREKRREDKARQEKELTEEQLAKIGEVMAGTSLGTTNDVQPRT